MVPGEIGYIEACNTVSGQETDKDQDNLMLSETREKV